MHRTVSTAVLGTQRAIQAIIKLNYTHAIYTYLCRRYVTQISQFQAGMWIEDADGGRRPDGILTACLDWGSTVPAILKLLRNLHFSLFLLLIKKPIASFSK